jgi:uncharacterized membrane protein YjjP (DUF1212 family)
VTDAAIHPVSGEACGFVCSLTGSQWIATGFALAMTRVVGFAMAIIGKRNGQSFLFTLHPSIFTLPLLAFLKNYTEASGGATGIRGAGLALSRT